MLHSQAETVWLPFGGGARFDTLRCNETREFLHLEQTYTTLAENKEWMAVHIDKMINGGGLIRPDFRAYFAGTAYRGF
jgi:hypothetical protein